MRGAIRIFCTGVVLVTGCAGPLGPVVMHSNDPANPAATVRPFEPPRNVLALGVEVPMQQEGVATHQHAADLGTPLYVCPMHPEVTADAPGRCPSCGMNLKIKEER